MNKMIRIAAIAVIFCTVLLMISAIITHAKATDGNLYVNTTQLDNNVNYMELMMQCVENGSEEALIQGATYEQLRNLKIETNGYIYEKTHFFDCMDASVIREKIDAYMESHRKKELKLYYTEEEKIMLAKVLYRECGAVKSVTAQACVAWTALNRVDYEGDVSLKTILTRPNQFVYDKNAPVTDHLYWLAGDVLTRWNNEKNGLASIGRVLPKEYRYFASRGDGKNYFRNKFKGDFDVWDFSLPSPYES